MSPAPLNPPDITSWDDWKGCIIAIIFSIFAAWFITTGSLVYKLATADPKKRKIKSQ